MIATEKLACLGQFFTETKASEETLAFSPEKTS